MPMPKKPRRREDVGACVRATIDHGLAEGGDRNAAVALAFEHCALPGVPAIHAAEFHAVVNRPGVEFPALEGVNHPVPVRFTADFLRAIHERSPDVVPANLLHAGRGELEVVGTARHYMEGDELRAEFFVDEATPHGAVTLEVVRAGIADGEPVQVSFEVDDLRFAESDEELMRRVAAGEEITPVDGVLEAVSILPGVDGACGSDCALSALAACEAGGSCGSDCCGHGSRVTVRGFIGAPEPDSQTLKGDASPTEDLSPMTPEEIAALQAEKTRLEADLADANEARQKAEEEVTELREQAENPTPSQEEVALAAKVSELENTVKAMKDREALIAEEARQALVEEVTEAAPPGFEVNADASPEVLAAQLAAFQAKPAVIKARPGAVRARSAATAGEITDDDKTVARLLAKRAGSFTKELPTVFRKHGTAFDEEVDA